MIQLYQPNDEEGSPLIPWSSMYKMCVGEGAWVWVWECVCDTIHRLSERHVKSSCMYMYIQSTLRQFTSNISAVNRNSQEMG